MKIRKWSRTILLLLWTAESLVLRLSWFALTLWWSKFWAVRAYQHELRRAGLPRQAVRKLVKAYDISLGDIVRVRWRGRGI